MKIIRRTSLYLLIVSKSRSLAWSVITPPSISSEATSSQLSTRREAVFNVLANAGVVATTTAGCGIASKPAWALPDEETLRITTRMGGLLESFQDGGRGVRLMAPSGWNKFEGEVGAYDLKWQDLVDPSENIKISSTPIKSTTESVAALGDASELGKVLAAKRNAKLLATRERLTDGVLFYQFEFAINDGSHTHQLLQLCVCKGKLWSMDANAKESRWSKRAALYDNVLGSFIPKLG